MNTFSITISLLAITLVGLSGCGGATPTISTSAEVMTVFGNGSGVARISDEDATGVLMGSDIQSFVNDVNSTGDEVSAADTSNVTYDHSNTFGDYFAGSATINGSPIDVIEYQSFSRDVVIVYAANNNDSIIATAGAPVTNIPTGSFQYTGTNILANRDASYSEDGSFLMNVNFSTGDAAITGSTATSTFGGTGISVNTSNGTFSDSNITMSLSGGSNRPATITGQFHGNGATGVTGIYHDNSSNPLQVGIFAGER